jgi:hypothetical protein
MQRYTFPEPPCDERALEPHDSAEMLDSFGQPIEDPPSGRAKVTYVTDGIELELTGWSTPPASPTCTPASTRPADPTNEGERRMSRRADAPGVSNSSRGRYDYGIRYRKPI